MIFAEAVLGAFLIQGGECPSIASAARGAYERRAYRDAVTLFEQARRICVPSHVFLLPLAQAQLMAGQINESLKSLDTLLAIDRKNPDALKLQGDVLYLTGREKEAVDSLTQALAIDPDHSESRYALGRIYYQQNRFPDAVQAFRQLIEKDPKNYRAHDNLALSYAGLGDDANALRHFLKALDLVHKDHPAYDTAYADFAHFTLDRGQPEKAFQLAAEAAKRNPTEPRNFFLTGKALAALDKPDLSIRWFEQAAKLDAAYPEPHYWLAQVYRKLGRAEDAAREVKLFRELTKRPRVRR